MATTDDAPPATKVAPPPTGGRPWLIALASCLGYFLVVLDISVVNVALPSIADALDLGASGLQWVVNAYAVTFAGFLLLGGRAADLFGRKRIYLGGLGLFTVASLVGGLAQDGGSLIAARAGQGVGAAVLAPVTLSLITATYPEGPARTRAVSAWTTVGVAGGAAGGLIGGVLTDYLSWRWVLLINVPLGLVVGALVLLGLREPQRSAARSRLDVPGAVLVTVGVAALAYGIGRTEHDGWTAAGALVPLVGGLVALVAFVSVEARSNQPLVPLRLFRIRGVAVGNLVSLVSMIGGFALWYFLTLYMQNVMGYGAARTGVAFLPHCLAITVAAQLAPGLITRFGSRTTTVVGGVLVGAGFLWQGAVMDADGTFLSSVLGPGLVMSVGLGLMMTPLTVISTTGADEADAGALAGVVNTSRQIGCVLGLSVLSAVATAEAGSAGLAAGYARAFLVAGVITIGAMVLVPLLPRSGGPRT